LLPLVAVIFVLTACGGSDGGGNNNLAPSAASGSLNIPSNVAVSDKLLATDPENNALTYTILNPGTNGTAKITDSSTGEYTYTPDASVVTGSDTITFKVNDGTSDSNIATILISIVDATSAIDDGYAVDEGATINTNASNSVLVNDISNPSDTLTALIVGNGPLFAATSFALNADGTFDYTHDGSENLTDSFTYKVNNGRNDSNTATVTINVTAINDAPLANDNTYNITESGTLIVPVNTGVRTNATDVDNVNSDLSVIIVTPPTDAISFTPASDGSFTYVHNGVNSTTDSFTYRVNDGTVNSNNIATATINITPVNDAPVAKANTYGVAEGGTLNVNVTSGLRTNATDIDNAIAELSVIIVTQPAKAASFTPNADGSFIYVHNGDELPASDTFTYKVNDGLADSNTVTATINITPVNDAPVGSNQSYTINEGGTLTVNITNGLRNNASDADNTIAELSAIIVLPPSFAQTFTHNSNGSFTYIHDGSETTNDSFTFKLNDGIDDSIVYTANILIVPVNDPPVATIGLCETTLRGNSGIKLGTVTATDVDDPANALTYMLQTDGTKGFVTNLDLATGTFDYTPKGGVDDWGTDTFSFTVTDFSGATDTATVTVIIGPKIMPLGDSITAGVWGPGTLPGTEIPVSATRLGYRQPLFKLLTDNFYPIDFVGNQSDGAGITGFDVNHQGLAGWSAAQIATGVDITTQKPELPNTITGNVYDWLVENPTEFILLHIGTNAFDANSQGDVESILNEINRFEEFRYGGGNTNKITVLLARIIDSNPLNALLKTFNDNVQTMALDRVSNTLNPGYPDNIMIINQTPALIYKISNTEPFVVGNDLFSSLHPNTLGYTKMANTWYTTLQGLLPKCP